MAESENCCCFPRPLGEDTYVHWSRMDFGWENGCHIAVIGASGTGKTSLVNALRGYRNGEHGAAPVGRSSGTTREIHKSLLSDRTPVWVHDIPSVDMDTVGKVGFFKQYLLGLYDCVVVVYSGWLQPVDLRIIEACDYRRVSVCLVRTQSDRYMRKIMEDWVAWSVDMAKDSLSRDARNDVDEAFKKADLPDKLKRDVYHINKNGLYGYVTLGQSGQFGVHEDCFVERLHSFKRPYEF
ncbi:hypothetical protein BO94DRAFT_580288 [Aspergillus sclerotioniger CBS 115572]|uniref:IRG-type G domain-containing protein n=1 Tax=Aspergillus sclerotioniger CBS 115572 TaxID=1450535 RepID=A0A317XD39_9EURO|nr:hypothetical protein BO94DRAFT_580288 [Aspergillus sclerotioniger CBS 115572]PWY96439.1 hypothetical protein BO94DRAFT_580288 [Aspergillus sclerotioniger CBS 115572]